MRGLRDAGQGGAGRGADATKTLIQAQIRAVQQGAVDPALCSQVTPPLQGSEGNFKLDTFSCQLWL